MFHGGKKREEAGCSCPRADLNQISNKTISVIQKASILKYGRNA